MILLLTQLAFGQQFAFPSSPADHPEYYPTAYMDHDSGGGLQDWDCATLTYDGHRGTDLGAGSFAGMDAGRDVNAAAPGVVTATHDGEFDRCTTADCPGGGGFGNYLTVQHADGSETLYGHLKQWSLTVAVNDEVGCGDKLGEMGSSGYSTGPHLHFQLNDVWGTATDPFQGACVPATSRWVVQNGWDDLPSLDCDTTWPGCQTEGTLTCGDVVVGRSDDPGSTSVHGYWGCTDYSRYTGPERMWRVLTDLDEPVTVELTGLTADLDLFVVADFDCDGRNCETGSTSTAQNDESVTYDAAAGVEMALAIDGWEGAVSDFRLEVLCSGGLPQTGTGTGTTTGTATAGTSGTGAATGSSGTGTGTTAATGTGTGPLVLPAPKSCGCSQGPLPAGALWLPLLALIRRRS